MAKTKSELQDALDRLRVASIKDAPTVFEEVQYHVDRLEDKYEDLESDLNSAEARIATLEGRLESEKIAELRHSHNWEGNTWKPLLHSTEPDILRVLDEAFLEVE